MFSLCAGRPVGLVEFLGCGSGDRLAPFGAMKQLSSGNNTRHLLFHGARRHALDQEPLQYHADDDEGQDGSE